MLDSQDYQIALQKAKSHDATVSFILDRHGHVSQVKMERPTGSDALDRRAMRIVSSRQYPPFPDTAWPGKIIRPFTATFSFR